MAEHSSMDLEKERTQYSNERTLLAYVRTFIEFLLASIGYIHVIVAIFGFQLSWFAAIPAVIICLVGVFFLVYGLKIYYARKSKIGADDNDD